LVLWGETGLFLEDLIIFQTIRGGKLWGDEGEGEKGKDVRSRKDSGHLSGVNHDVSEHESSTPGLAQRFLDHVYENRIGFGDKNAGLPVHFIPLLTPESTETTEHSNQ
jgi:hypothetical protein